MGAMNPSQQSTGGEQSVVAPSQHLQQGRSYVWSIRPDMAVHAYLPWWLI